MEDFRQRIEMNALATDLTTPTASKVDCKGQIYRFAYDMWMGSDGDYNFRYRFRWIKTLSCTGCDVCLWLEDDMREQFSRGFEYMPEMFDNVSPGKLYRLKMTDWSRDWETGYIDDYTIGFEEIKDDKANNSVS